MPHIVGQRSVPRIFDVVPVGATITIVEREDRVAALTNCSEAGIVQSGVTRYSEPDGNRDLDRSEEHTSELQSLTNLVCRLLLEKKKKKKQTKHIMNHTNHK